MNPQIINLLIGIFSLLGQLSNALPSLVKEVYIENLIECESQGNPTAVNWEDAKITGYQSKGILQFQPKTFLNEGKKYGLFPEDFTLRESNLMIENPELQKEIARHMIEDNKQSAWSCSKQIATL